MPQFFVSYARGDDDPYVEEFFADLCAAVRARGGGADAVGFLGSDEAANDEWPPALAASVASCGAFVALCSPRLLLSEGAGRQWWIFRERLRRYADETGRRAPALLPVRWASIPAALEPGTPVPVDEEDPQRPLRQFLRLRDLRAEYRRFLTGLADRIVEALRAHTLPRYDPVPAFHRTPNAFADVRRTAAVPAGPKVRFVVAAGSRDELESVRESLQFYGKEAVEWAPYRPILDRPLAEHAQAIAGRRLLSSDVGELGDLGDRLEEARQRNELVVLLMDAWATRLPAYRTALARTDREDIEPLAVIVPISNTDPESAENRDDLRFEVERVISGCIERADALFRFDVPDPGEFDADLGNLIEEGRNRIFRTGRPHHVPAGPAAGDRPILRGP